ncbi:hypothetical protein QA645_31940 [Bradyrhizobium sp. CIAT3101]|uniref:hypothetical protein n=1 Tax=Bradyrhizobium sp. CIAT3101 TaxID=439387 RepID=UPI0024B19E0E|nr:hypothetical protein [Bradyrhizobium sp. CIAT3101]WFU79108.1 hypothetical protein QA645_31940 [Bradyrhizobium sp. CIAT3101]
MPTSISAAATHARNSAMSNDDSDSDQLFAVSLFTGIGLLVSIIVALSSIQGL